MLVAVVVGVLAVVVEVNIPVVVLTPDVSIVSEGSELVLIAIKFLSDKNVCAPIPDVCYYCILMQVVYFENLPKSIANHKRVTNMAHILLKRSVLLPSLVADSVVYGAVEVVAGAVVVAVEVIIVFAVLDSDVTVVSKVTVLGTVSIVILSNKNIIVHYDCTLRKLSTHTNGNCRT